MPHTRTDSTHDKHIWVGIKLSKNLWSTTCFSILNTVRKRSIFCTTTVRCTLFLDTRVWWGGGGKKQWRLHIHINIHKYSHDACANIHDVDMNTNACAHACVNAHTHAYMCVYGCTHVHACAHNHNTHIATYIMNRILNRKNSQICL